MSMQTQVARKRFGQHFLCDKNMIDRIVALIAPKSSEHLIEIGPGQGALTIPVLKIVNTLEVVELDRNLIPELKMRAAKAGDLIVYEQDALTFNFAELKKDKRLLRIFGNLPYNISTPLIFHLLTFSADVADMVFMLQKEVAERLAAAPDSEHYGRLSVMVQYHCKVELAFNVPPSAFYPQPAVQSSMVKLIPYRELPYRVADYTLFATLVREAFGHRRKTLRNSLKTLITDEQWQNMPISSTLRAENLSVENFVTLANILSQAV